MAIREAKPADLQLIAGFIRELAEYERLAHAVAFDEAELGRYLFGERPSAEVLIAEDGGGEPVGFALFFHNFSTFLGRPGIYLARRSRRWVRAIGAWSRAPTTLFSVMSTAASASIWAADFSAGRLPQVSHFSGQPGVVRQKVTYRTAPRWTLGPHAAPRSDQVGGLAARYRSVRPDRNPEPSKWDSRALLLLLARSLRIVCGVLAYKPAAGRSRSHRHPASRRHLEPGDVRRRESSVRRGGESDVPTTDRGDVRLTGMRV